MADKTPLKYESGQHKPFEPGDKIPDSYFDLRGLIHAGEGFEVTEDAQGRVTITNTCCAPPDSEHIIAEVNAPATVEEGEQVCWTIVLDGPVEGSDLTLQGVLSGDEQDQHNYPAPSVTIPVGSSTGQMCVQTTDDTTVEPDRELCLAVAANPRIVNAPAPRCVTVEDNDCAPNWQDTGTIRCTGANVEAFQEDGCGNSRWNDTGTPVAWTNDGAAVCVDDVLIQPQVNQCGDTRDFDTGEACGAQGPSIPAAIENVLGCCPRPVNDPGEMILHLNGDGTAAAGSNCGYAPAGQRWIAPGDSASNYEIRYVHIDGRNQSPGPGWVNAGSGFQFSVAVGGGSNQQDRSMFRLFWREVGSADPDGQQLIYAEIQVTSGAPCL